MIGSPFLLRSYGWTELAQLYNPTLQPDSAARLLRRWVEKNTLLANALQQSGYRSGQRKLTPLQVADIVRYLGEP